MFINKQTNNINKNNRPSAYLLMFGPDDIVIVTDLVHMELRLCQFTKLFKSVSTMRCEKDCTTLQHQQEQQEHMKL